MPAAWSAVGAGLFCPVAVSPESGRVVLLARAGGGELVRVERDGAGWRPPRSLGVPVARSRGGSIAVPVDWQLAACTGGPDAIELAARSPDGDLLHLRLTPDGPAEFECLGAPAAAPAGRAIRVGLAGPPAICRSGPGHLDVFAMGPGGEVLHAIRSRDEWGPFESLGSPPEPSADRFAGRPAVVEAVAACRYGPSGMALFHRGAEGQLLLKWWNGADWSDYASLGSPDVPDESYPAVRASAPLTGPPAACSRGADWLDVFARGPYGDLVHTGWDGAGWSRFESLGMPADGEQPIPLTGTVTACSTGGRSCDVVAGAVDGRLHYLRWSDDADDA
jgi:hypothetical protein